MHFDPIIAQVICVVCGVAIGVMLTLMVQDFRKRTLAPPRT